MSAKRKNDLIKATIEAIKEQGINKVTRADVTNKTACSPALINYYFGSFEKLINRAAWQGVEDKDFKFILQLLTINHEAVEDYVIIVTPNE